MGNSSKPNSENKKRKPPTLKEFAKIAKCKDYMAAAFHYAVFKSRKISVKKFFEDNSK